MKSKIKNIEECKKLLQIEISEDIVKRTTEEVYRQIKRIARIPGFRTGSAPQDLLEKHYAKDAEEGVLKRLVPEGYRKAIETHKVNPIGQPRFLNIDFKAGKPFTFEAEVDIRPAIKLKNYKGIRVNKKRVSLSQDEVSDSLSRMRDSYAEYIDVTRPIQKKDYAICDVEVFIEGKPISRKSRNMWIMADKEASLLGMGEELIGLAKGHTKEIETKLPENYPDKKYAGRLAKFTVSINEVKEKKLPELDDEFAKKLNCENLEGLKKEIESQLFKRKEMSLRINMQNQILDRLLKDNKFSVPPGICKRQKEVFVKRLEAELRDKGISEKDIADRVKELDGKLELDAKTRVQVYFLLDDIAAKENIEVTDNDLEEKFKAIALVWGSSKDEVKKYYEKENLLDGLAEEIKEDKVLGLLLKSAEITEEKDK